MRHVLYRVDTNGNLLLKWKSCSSSISSTSLSPFPLPSLLRGVQASQNNEVPSWSLVTLLSPTVPRAFLPVPPPSLQPSSAQASSLCLLCWCVTAPALLTQTATGTWDRQPAGPAPALPQVLLGLGGSGDPHTELGDAGSSVGFGSFSSFLHPADTFQEVPLGAATVTPTSSSGHVLHCTAPNPTWAQGTQTLRGKQSHCFPRNTRLHSGCVSENITRVQQSYFLMEFLSKFSPERQRSAQTQG